MTSAPRLKGGLSFRKGAPRSPLAALLRLGRERCADQSTVADTLPSMPSPRRRSRNCAGGQAVETIHRQQEQGRVFTHDFEQELLILEVDLTGLTASKNAEESTKGKGYFPGKRNRRGRQLVRVIASQYGGCSSRNSTRGTPPVGKSSKRPSARWSGSWSWMK